MLPALVLALAACEPPPPSPPAFDEATAFLFRAFDQPSETDLAFALRAAEETLRTDLDLEGPTEARSLTLPPLTAEDVADVTRPPDTDPSTAQTMFVAARSAFPPARHAALQLRDDQRPLEPNAPDHYERTFREGRGCWLDRDCALRTSNDLVRKSAVVVIPFVLRKDFRWVDMDVVDPDATAPRWAYVARSWVPERATGGIDTLHQQYSVEAWIPDDDGLVRFISLYYDVETPLVPEAAARLTAQSGIDAIFRAAEEALAAE
ncbi:MAG: hypothetical protein H6732_18375 [Alphaproteobacteria bacterium]|nr:hypothetical protein [Alphaproteobacteria bacterium]